MSVKEIIQVRHQPDQCQFLENQKRSGEMTSLLEYAVGRQRSVVGERYTVEPTGSASTPR
jgi:hypothetical protein